MSDRLVLPCGTGEVVVERHGGRVAELRPSPEAPNLLWRGDTAPVPGGDRLWPAPETEIFYEGGEWRIPPGLDPGDWTLRAEEGTVVLEQRALGARFLRRVEPLSDLDTGGLPWAGYVVTDAVDTDRAWSAWHLVMVVPPMRLYVHGARDPVVYYPPVPHARDGWYPATGQAPRWKVGFPPPPDGRVLLAGLGEADPGPMVVVQAEAPPDGTYVDAPPGGGPGTAVQLFDAGGEGFCELEHHAPLETRTTRSTVLGVWGPRSERLALLGRLRQEDHGAVGG